MIDNVEDVSFQVFFYFHTYFAWSAFPR